MKTLNIKSTHATLALAVASSALDLSYNAQSAAQSIRNTDTGFGRDKGTVKAFIVESGDVYYIYRAMGMNLLHKFEPFISCLSSDGFAVAQLSKDGAAILISDVRISQDKAGRDIFRGNLDLLAA